jgi:parallel beta-helix repeat protein
MVKRRLRVLWITLALLAATSCVSALGPLGGAQAALAAPLRCGDRITVDTTLHADLVGCRNNGIVIGADDITLDLNGHRIDGDNALVDSCRRICDVGVLNNGHNGVRIKDGDIRQFGVGVLVFGARRNGLSDLTTAGNVFGGIILAGTAGSSVRWSKAVGNAGPDTGFGIALFESHNNRIAHNRLFHNADSGIHLVRSNRNYVANNVVRRNSLDGIDLEGNRNVIVGNRVVRNSITVTLFSRGAEAVGNVVRRNIVRRAPHNGISIDRAIERTVVKRNHVFGAGSHGILVGNPTTTVTRNEARYNHRLGIKAVKGTIDGGGNRASGNGDPRQCVNISCSR